MFLIAVLSLLLFDVDLKVAQVAHRILSANEYRSDNNNNSCFLYSAHFCHSVTFKAF